MNGINSREHRILEAAFDKFEAMSSAFPYIIEESQDAAIREGMESLEKLYEKYKMLYTELEKCIRDYEVKKKKVRTAVNKGNRKLNGILIKNPIV